MPEVVGVEMLDSPDPNVGRLLVRARRPELFFAELNRLVLEEWYDVTHLRPVDESTQAVLGMLLASRR